MRLFKQLLCKHTQIEFVRNIYGDEINHRNAKCRGLDVVMF